MLLVLLSGVVEETNAVFGIVLSPGALTLTTIVTEAKPGDVMVPRFATALVPWRAHEPWLEEHETKLVPPGSGSVTTTFSAALGPLLLTEIVYVRKPPVTTGFGEAVLAIERSAPGLHGS